MKIGDLVEFRPQGGLSVGALTAVKYFERMRRYSEGKPGIILHVHETTCLVLFGDKTMVVNKHHLGLIDEDRGHRQAKH